MDPYPLNEREVMPGDQLDHLIGKAVIALAIGDAGTDDHRFQTVQHSSGDDLFGFDLGIMIVVIGILLGLLIGREIRRYRSPDAHGTAKDQSITAFHAVSHKLLCATHCCGNTLPYWLAAALSAPI